MGVLAAYEVEASRSRLRVCNDNPNSESIFRTLKYPSRAPYLEVSLKGCRMHESDFWPNVHDYNEDRYYSGINYVTPNVCASGEEVEILSK